LARWRTSLGVLPERLYPITHISILLSTSQAVTEIFAVRPFPGAWGIWVVTTAFLFLEKSKSVKKSYYFLLTLFLRMGDKMVKSGEMI
jgi:hypothetical protein